jgi:hypothetical protein
MGACGITNLFLNRPFGLYNAGGFSTALTGLQLTFRMIDPERPGGMSAL